MHILRCRPLYWSLSLLVVALMTSSVRVYLTPACAQAREVTAAVVIPVTDATGGRDPMIGAKATDALALALEDSRSYRVISKADLQRELTAQDMTPPLNESMQLRVGQDLQADVVVTATLTKLAPDGSNGAVSVAMDLRAYNIPIRAVLSGAAVQVNTKAIPGFNGDLVPVINEALRQVAEAAVAEMERTRIRHGSIYLVDDQGVITTDLGINDGVGAGTRLLVMRGYWDRSLEQTVMRPLGVIELTGVQVRLSQAKVVSGRTPRIGDRVYVLYSPPSEVKSIQKGHKTTSSLRLLAAGALILGIVATATGNQNITPPVVGALVSQEFPGSTPVIRVNISRNLNPDPEHTHAFLFYRGRSAGFVADATAMGDGTLDGGPLVAIVPDAHLNYYEDTQDRQVGITSDISFDFFSRAGEQETGTLTATYNHAELVAGNTYYYKVRRLVDPWRPILPNPQQEFIAVTFAVDPPDALGNPSPATPPVTYSLPAVQQRPLGSTTVNPQAATFEWMPSRGADQYQVQVYLDRELTQLVTASPTRTAATGQTLLRYTFNDFIFPGDTTMWWVVASRTSGETKPSCKVGGSRTLPWVLSERTSFKTVALPPGPAAAAVEGGRPTGVRGWWRERRTPGR